jgi:hypothetical protein
MTACIHLECCSYGFNVYANGIVGKATYTGTGVPSNLYVADTPIHTQSFALTYQAHGLIWGRLKSVSAIITTTTEVITTKCMTLFITM